jgi:hypothetical protein
MDERDAAARDLERIRVLMERAGKFSHLSAAAAFTAAGLAVAGVLISWKSGAGFDDPRSARTLAWIWGAILALALAQGFAFTLADARRRGDPFWSPLTRQVAVAMLPAFFIGAAVTGFGLQTARLDLLPPFWSLAHGSSLVALGLFAGRRIQAVGVLLLLAGAAALFFWRDHGLIVMSGTFGGGHLLLGALILWKRRRSAA